MLQNLITYTIKPFWGSSVSLLIIFILLLVYSQIFLYRRSAKNKPPIVIAVLSGLLICYGVQAIAVIFLIKGELNQFFILLLGKVIIFIIGVFYIFLGICLLRLHKWARNFILVSVALGGLIDFVLVLTRPTLKVEDVLLVAGFYIAVFSVYFFGLNEKYFKKEESFSLREDAAKKKERSTITDFFKE